MLSVGLRGGCHGCNWCIASIRNHLHPTWECQNSTGCRYGDKACHFLSPFFYKYLFREEFGIFASCVGFVCVICNVWSGRQNGLTDSLGHNEAKRLIFSILNEE